MLAGLVLVLPEFKFLHALLLLPQPGPSWVWALSLAQEAQTVQAQVIFLCLQELANQVIHKLVLVIG